MAEEQKVQKEEETKEELQNQPQDAPEASSEKVVDTETDEKVSVVDEEEVKEEKKKVKEVEDVDSKAKAKAAEVSESWTPKTEIGKKVKSKEITDIDEIIDSGRRILEPEITDMLLPNMDIELLAIGQSKGKFGGGQRRVFRQTQKKTREGNKPQFSAYAVCGNYDGYVGFGFGKAKETVPAREKAFRKCKLNIIKIKRSCNSWECSCGTPHSIPYKVTGKCGSVEVTLMPAPKGTGLVAEKEMAKILKLAGIKDVWSKTKGKTRTKINHIHACIDALRKLTETKTTAKHKETMNIVEGRIKINA